MKGAVLAGMCLFALPAVAQQAREGNTYDFRKHQPRPGIVAPAERRAGIGLSPAQNRARTGTVERLDRKLLDREKTDPPR